MKRQFQTGVLVIAVSIVMVAASHPCYADLGDQLAKLLADDGAAGDIFGNSVAISGTTAIVGAVGDGDNGHFSGSAYLFDISDPANPVQIAKLLPDDGAAGDFFGISVGISGATAIVGAERDDTNNGINSGSAYLFDTTTGEQLFKLLPNDGAESDKFGLSVAISGTTAIVGTIGDDDRGGASGSAYLFDAVTGRQIAKILALDGGPGNLFGRSIAISGDTAIVGAVGDGDNGIFSGSAYLFDVSDPVNPVQIAKLLPDDGAQEDRFSRSVAISGEIAIVGAKGDDDNGSGSGSAYLFDTTTGEQIAKLLADDGAAGDEFGWSVGISGPPGEEVAIVGAPRDDDNGENSGSGYLFDVSDPANPTQLFKLLADDGAAGDRFGGSVAISGATAIVGAPEDNDNGDFSGSAYLFDAGSGSGTPATLTDFTIVDGTLVSGGLAQLDESDDQYLETEAKVTGEAAETHRLLMRISAMTAVQNPTTIDITLEGHITDIEAIVTLFLRDFDTEFFEQVGQFTNGLGADTTNTVNVPNAARFVRNDGRIELYVRKIVILPFTLNGFHSLEDLLEIRVR